MLDIHNHTLFGVDDGAESLEISIAMLKEAKKQQIDAVILTALLDKRCYTLASSEYVLTEYSLSHGVCIYTRIYPPVITCRIYTCDCPCRTLSVSGTEAGTV